jgi:hypothetical protein
MRRHSVEIQTLNKRLKGQLRIMTEALEGRKKSYRVRSLLANTTERVKNEFIQSKIDFIRKELDRGVTI